MKQILYTLNYLLLELLAWYKYLPHYDEVIVRPPCIIFWGWGIHTIEPYTHWHRLETFLERLAPMLGLSYCGCVDFFKHWADIDVSMPC